MKHARITDGLPIFFGVLSLILAGCASTQSVASHPAPPNGTTVTLAPNYSVTTDSSLTGHVTIADGTGLIYAPIEIVQELGVLETKYPNLKVSWSKIFSSDAQRDAMLAGQLDFATSTPGPFLQARDAGVDLKVAQVVSGWDAQLLVPKNGPDNIGAFISSSQKLSPGPSSAQSYAVEAALQAAGNDPHALDKRWVSLTHPDGLQALLTGSLGGEFATANYIIDAMKTGKVKSILSFRDVYDGHLYTTAAVTLGQTAKQHPELVTAYADALQYAVKWMKNNPNEAAAILSKYSGGVVTAAQELSYLESDIFVPQTNNGSFDYYANALQSIGVVKTVPKSPSQIYAIPEDAGSNW